MNNDILNLEYSRYSSISLSLNHLSFYNFKVIKMLIIIILIHFVNIFKFKLNLFIF